MKYIKYYTDNKAEAFDILKRAVAFNPEKCRLELDRDGAPAKHCVTVEKEDTNEQDKSE